jgi:polysaccharide export outer membrane protein
MFIVRIAQAAVAALLFFSLSAHAVEAQAVAGAAYRLQPGDQLLVNAWKEQELQSEVLVRPDGGISFPLAGDVAAAGRSVEELRADLEARLGKFIPDVVVTVSVKAVSGNRIYVLGKVNRPGDYVMARPTDVMQSLSLAGGTTPFAEVDSIRVLRRESGKLRAIEFHYTDVERGRRLEQNVMLQGGDTVVVP